MSRIYVTKDDKIEKYENHLVKLTLSAAHSEEAGEGEIVGLEPRRLFPVSNPASYITLLDEDGRSSGNSTCGKYLRKFPFGYISDGSSSVTFPIVVVIGIVCCLTGSYFLSRS